MPEKGKIKKDRASKRKWNNPLAPGKVGRSMHSMLDGSFLTRQKFIRGIPFILFLMFLGILYITNIFKVERTKRQLDDLDEELRELRYEYISSRSKLMYESKPSEVSSKLKDTGIKETLIPPRKIKLEKSIDKQGYAGR